MTNYKRIIIITKNTLLISIMILIICNLLIIIMKPDMNIPDDWSKPHQISKTNLVHELKVNYSGNWQGILIETNELGLRDKSYPIKKEVNTKRIIVIGDSVIFGVRVNEQDTFSSVLENKLNNNSEINYEVWNAGVSCYNSVENYLQLKKLLTYEPDMIILGFVNNDISDPSCFVFDKESFINNNLMIKMIEHTFLRRINLTNLIIKNIYNYQKKKAIIKFDKLISNDYVQENKNAFFKMLNLTEQKNISLIILNIPSMKEPYYSSYQQEIINSSKKLNKTMIDIYQVYQQEGIYWQGSLRQVNEDYLHPNEKGHKLIAERIFQELNIKS